MKIKNQGFTLIEIMIVIAILGALMAVVAPKLVKKNQNPKQFVRKLTVLSKELKNFAKLKNSTYRLVFELDEAKGDTYWIEMANQKVLLSEEDLRKEREANERDEYKSPFTINKEMLKEPQQFPNGLIIQSIQTQSSPEPIKSGKAYVHFFPEGMVEETAIQITDKKNLKWTLYINPITGKMDVVQEFKELKDIRQ